jgi:hypothetical protein
MISILLFGVSLGVTAGFAALLWREGIERNTVPPHAPRFELQNQGQIPILTPLGTEDTDGSPRQNRHRCYPKYALDVGYGDRHYRKNTRPTPSPSSVII